MLHDNVFFFKTCGCCNLGGVKEEMGTLRYICLTFGCLSISK
jgi:hypothetical protein